MDSLPSPALVFDLDGTLVDTAPDLLGALNAILLQEGRRPVNHADLRHLVGLGSRSMLVQAFEMTGPAMDETRLPGLIVAYIAHYKKHIAVASRPFPGVEATLGRLKAGGARLAVLTNKPQELTDLLLPALDLTGFFGAIHGAGRMEVNKPDARVFHAVVDELGGPGAGAVMIGDSITDVNTARAAGVPVIVVDYGYTPEPAHLLGADAVTGDFSEIPALARRLLS
jgi:phosphoglycolate phosphatase